MAQKQEGQELLKFILGLLTDEKEKALITAIQECPTDEEAVEQLIKLSKGRKKND